MATKCIEISALQRFRALLEARESGRPVAYLIGRRGFWTLDLAVTADTLIPRPETELLVELAIARLPVFVSVAGRRPGHRQRRHRAGHRERAAAMPGDRHGRKQRRAGHRHRQRARAMASATSNSALGSWFSPLTGERFDLIASNPPYIAEGDPHLEQGDLRFEPAAALSSGADGLEAIREIVSGAGAHLVAGGWLLLEHGLDQGAAIRDLFEAAGFVDVGTERDLESRDRVTLGAGLASRRLSSKSSSQSS